MQVRYLHKGEYQGAGMTVGHVYEVLGIEADSYRIIDNTHMPYLYNPNQFEIVDALRPHFWVSELGDDGEEYAYPKAWHLVGFFEDFYDGNKDAISIFWAECERLYGIKKTV